MYKLTNKKGVNQTETWYYLLVKERNIYKNK